MLAALALLLAGPATAGRAAELREALTDLRPAANAQAIPALARLLEATGWTPTPELSGAFEPGRVFQVTDSGHRLQLDHCFAREPARSSYTAAELVTRLQAGVGVSVGVGALGAHASIVKRLSFGAPEQRSLPALQMTPSAACRVALDEAARRGLDLATLYVVQEALFASIAEQTCGRVDASGRFVALGEAEAGLAAACSQESLEPVAIGYRTLPVADLLSLPAPSTPPPLLPVPWTAVPTRPDAAVWR